MCERIRLVRVHWLGYIVKRSACMDTALLPTSCKPSSRQYKDTRSCSATTAAQGLEGVGWAGCTQSVHCRNFFAPARPLSPPPPPHGVGGAGMDIAIGVINVMT
jgi:hypothetical protein